MSTDASPSQIGKAACAWIEANATRLLHGGRWFLDVNGGIRHPVNGTAASCACPMSFPEPMIAGSSGAFQLAPRHELPTIIAEHLIRAADRESMYVPTIRAIRAALLDALGLKEAQASS